jgi:predicted Rossmann fold nucleotide-binding protein DprA/Smf involved in DNA uptake
MFYFPTHIKIISGGQTGVDRAALDFAIKHNISCGGWCPKGRMAEDGTISSKYPLKETISSTYNERTKRNIEDSDATLIFYSQFMDAGTKVTVDYCTNFNKSLLIINLNDNLPIAKINNWLEQNNINNLNIAGPRESNSPGIYRKTYEILNSLSGKSREIGT